MKWDESKSVTVSGGKETHFPALDTMRFCMAIAVVAIHSNPLYGKENTFLYAVYDAVVRLAVPVFFVISGFLLFQKMAADLNAACNILRIKRFLKRTLKMYLIWTVVYLPLGIFGILHFGGTLSIKTAISYAIRVIFKGESFYSWPLWYLLSSVYAGIFFGLLMRCKRNEKQIFVVSIILLALSYGMDRLVANADALGAPLKLAANLISITTGNGRILTGTPYMAVGMLLARMDRKKLPSRVLWGLFAVSFVAAVLNNEWLYTPFVILPGGLLTACVLVYLRGGHPSAKHVLMRNMSTCMYLLHMYFLFAYDAIFGDFEGVHQYGLPAFLFTSLCSAGISYAIAIHAHGQKSKLRSLLFGF